MAAIPAFFIFLILTLVAPSFATADPCDVDGSDLSVIPIIGKCSPFNKPSQEDSTWFSHVISMAAQDPNRLKYLSTLVAAQKTKTSVPIASGTQVLKTSNYVVRVKIGTPPQLMFMVLDTSSDSAWLPCFSSASTSATTFKPNVSSTYSPLGCSAAQCAQIRKQSLPCPASAAGPCTFNQTYGGDSSFSATLVQDSLQLADDTVPNFTFGCISSVSGGSIPPQGLMGLGRGSMSLLSQTTSIYNNVFSYCLPSFRSFYFSGSLKLGPSGQPKSIKTTPLLRNPHRPSLYYVNLTGVSVGRIQVNTDPQHLAFKPETGAGTIIDSGTVITRFVQPVYDLIKEEFRKQVKGPFSELGAFDTCFPVDYAAVAPKMTLHFTGMDLQLPVENTLIHSSAGSLACLAMAAAPNNVNSVLNVIANLQQQNLRILFDVANSRVGIAREICN